MEQLCNKTRVASEGRLQNYLDSEVVFATGRLSPAVGGPFNTLLNYRRVLEDSGVTCQVFALNADSDHQISAIDLRLMFVATSLRSWCALSGHSFRFGVGL